MKKLTLTSIIACAFCLFAVYAYADDYTFTDKNGVTRTIPDGEYSFAARVVEFIQGDPWTKKTDAQNPNDALGQPDRVANSDASALTLGAGGVLTVELNIDVTDGEGDDIYIFEVGDDAEPTKVEVSSDLVTWYDVGTAGGQTSGVDISGKTPKGGAYRYVRLTDLKKSTSGRWPGADIDAIMGLSIKPAISIYLNNEKIEFDREPINQDGNLLVPIRAIAEAMGKTVLWSDKYKAAFIDNTDNALIIPIEYDGMMSYESSRLLLADDSGYYSWDTVKTNVPPIILDGRTLVPIRQFAEALGADVEWVSTENAAYITYYNKNSGSMSDILFESINLNYYIAHYATGTPSVENPFKTYTANVIQEFYNSRNQTVDAIAMGISSSGDVISDIWNMYLYDETNASMAIQQTLYDVINEIPDSGTDVYGANISMQKDIKSYATTAKKIYDEANGIDDAFLEAHSALKYLNDTVKDLGDLFDFTAFSVEEIAYLLSDYSTNIGYLDVLDEAFASSYGDEYTNSNLMTAVDSLKKQYTNEFYQIVKDLHGEIINKTFSTALGTVTGGAYGIGKTVWSTVFKATGVTSKGSALETFYSIYSYNIWLDLAFDKAVANAVTNQISAQINGTDYLPDLDYIKAVIQLETATKKVAIDAIADTANWWAKENEQNAAEELKSELDAINCYVWSRS